MKRFLLYLFICFTISGCMGGEKESSLTKQGDLEFSRRNYREAVRLWNKAYNKSPDNAGLAKKLASCYVKLGRPERAKSLFKKSLEAHPKDIDASIRLAQLSLYTLDFQEAERIVSHWKSQGISNPEILILNADLNVLQDKTDKAESLYRQAVIESKDSLRTLMKLAIFLSSEGRVTEADELFQIVVKSEVKSTQILLLMADYYHLNDEIEKTKEAISGAIDMEPEEIALQYRLFLFHLETGKVGEAEKILNAMLEIGDDIYLRMMLADIRLSQGRIDEAEEIIFDINEKNTEQIAELELLKGKFWLYSGKTAFAASHFKAALAIKPGLANTRYYLGLTHLINRKVKLSENSLLATLQVYPDHPRALLLISQILYKQKEYDLSLDYLSKLLNLKPSHFKGMVLKGLNFLAKGKVDAAAKEFQKAALINGGNQRVTNYYLGVCDEKQKNFESALKRYRKIIDKNPQLVDVTFRYCNLLVELGQHDKVRQFIKQQFASEKLTSGFCYILSRISGKMGDLTTQETLLRRGIQIDEKGGIMYLELAALYQKKNQFEKSLAVLNRSIKVNPEFENAWITLSQSHIERRDLETALETLECGYDLFKTSPLYMANLAWLYLENNKELNRALSLAQAAYDKMPGDNAIKDTLGWAYYHKGVYSQAIWLLSEVEKKEPENPLVAYHLGMTYYRQGKFKIAARYLEKIKTKKEIAAYETVISETLEDIQKNRQDEARDSYENGNLISDPKMDELDAEPSES